MVLKFTFIVQKMYSLLALKDKSSHFDPMSKSCDFKAIFEGLDGTAKCRQRVS